MDISCPKCHNQLPEVETLRYRFCPHCGAEIPAEPKIPDNAFLTLPPDVSKPQKPKRTADVLRRQTDQNLPTTRSVSDQTSAPQPVVKGSRPKINPPDTPPPASFFRGSPQKKEPPPPDPDQQPPAKSRRNVMIAILILLVVIILIMGGLFTF